MEQKLTQTDLQTMLNAEQVETRLEAVRAFKQIAEFPESLFVKALGDNDWRVRKEAVLWFLQLPEAASRNTILLEQLQHPENAGLRNAAIEILISLGRQAIPDLTSELPRANAEVRKFIVDILGEIGSLGAIQHLLPVLQDEDENVRYAAVETLGKLRAIDAVEPLLELLKSADTGLAFTVFAALSSIGAGVPAKPLLGYCADPLLRKTVFNCLGKIGDPDGIQSLFEGLADPLRKVREAAVLGLGSLIRQVDDQVLLEAFKGQSLQACQPLIELLTHQDGQMRAAASQILSLFPSPEVIDQLLPLLAEERLRADLLVAFRRIPKALFYGLFAADLSIKDAAPVALELLTAEDPQLRFAAVMTLGKIGQVSAAALLGDRLNDDLLEIKEAAVEALQQLARLDAEVVVRCVCPYLESADAQLRMLVVRTLGQLDSTAGEDCLLMALKDSSAQVRCEALRGLNGGNSQRLFSGLTLALTDEVADVRRLAAEALGVFPADQANLVLAHAGEDSDPWVRMAAISAFREGEPQQLQAVIDRGLADPVGLVVIAALEAALGLLPGSAAVKFLAALDHQDEEVVRTATRLLVAVGDAESVLADPRSPVRLYALAEIAQADIDTWRPLLEKQLSAEVDPAVRSELEQLLRRSVEG